MVGAIILYAAYRLLNSVIRASFMLRGIVYNGFDYDFFYSLMSWDEDSRYEKEFDTKIMLDPLMYRMSKYHQPLNSSEFDTGEILLKYDYISEYWVARELRVNPEGLSRLGYLAKKIMSRGYFSDNDPTLVLRGYDMIAKADEHRWSHFEVAAEYNTYDAYNDDLHYQQVFSTQHGVLLPRHANRSNGWISGWLLKMKLDGICTFVQSFFGKHYDVPVNSLKWFDSELEHSMFFELFMKHFSERKGKYAGRITYNEFVMNEQNTSYICHNAFASYYLEGVNRTGTSPKYEATNIPENAQTMVDCTWMEAVPVRQPFAKTGAIAYFTYDADGPSLCGVWVSHWDNELFNGKLIVRDPDKTYQEDSNFRYAEWLFRCVCIFTVFSVDHLTTCHMKPANAIVAGIKSSFTPGTSLSKLFFQMTENVVFTEQAGLKMKVFKRLSKSH